VRRYTRRLRFGNRSGLGQPPTTRDVVNGLPMPADPNVGQLPIWLYPPVNWENIDQLNYVNLPAVGATATIITFQVPTGRNGIINKVACNFVGGGWVEGSGDVVWRILVDGGTPPGATSYDSILGSLGSPAQPVGISGFRIFENQVVTLVAFNNAVLVAGQKVGGRLLGYLYPREYEEENIWI
jgi:hypothetical protein